MKRARNIILDAELYNVLDEIKELNFPMFTYQDFFEQIFLMFVFSNKTSEITKSTLDKWKNRLNLTQKQRHCIDYYYEKLKHDIDKRNFVH